MTMINRLVVIAFCAIAASAASAQTQPKPDDSFIGFWASEQIFGPSLRGSLTVFHEGSVWNAKASTAHTTFTPRGDSIRFSFAGGLGRFRGAFSTSRREINGWWIQPKGNTGDPNDPGGLSQPFASPLTLRLARENVWTGNIVPLNESFNLYLNIYRGPSGLLVGAFRNPELNLRGGSAQFRVTPTKDTILFTARPDTTQPELRRIARYDSASREMVIWWPQIQRTFVLFPRTADQMAGYFPRVPRGFKYTYTAPVPENDGWGSARASSVGFDEAQLAKLVQRIIDTVQTSPSTPIVHSLLIARKGKLVLEEYFAGFDRNTPHDTRSAAKTFASVMLGAAMLKGYPVKPETSITQLLANRGPFANPDPRKARITLAHLMTHTSGLDCDDNEESSPGSEDRMQSQTEQPDWWKYLLDLKQVHDPGTHPAYCSGGMNLVGAGIVAGTKTWLPEFFDRTIAQPLQFGRYYYNLMPTYEGYTGGGVFMRPRDLLKIGQLYLNGGTWNGKRIVSKEWVDRSTQKSAGSDGLAWHPIKLKAGEKSYQEYEANGNGGQLLMVIPEFDLVVVWTAGNYGGYQVWGQFRNDLVPNAIIPAIRNNR